MDRVTHRHSQVSSISERYAGAVLTLAALLVAALIFWVLVDVLWQGVERLSWEFLTAAPSDAGRAGGIAPMLVSTLLILMVCLTVATPVAVGTAVWLAEFAASSRALRLSLDVLSGMPSIVFGLFGYVFFVQVLGLGFSILAGGLTLACMVLPVMIRASEESLRALPDGYRLGCAVLGLSRAATLWRLQLPAAMPGLAVGIVLGIGRALAETAALLYTSGYVDRMPTALSDSGRALSIHIFDMSMNVPGGDSGAYGAALVLLVMLLGINAVVFAMSTWWSERRLVQV